MTRSILSRVAGLVLVAGLVTVPAEGASAASAVLYVNNAATSCSDAGGGTLSEPYCTVGAAVAAVAAGQTIQIHGSYDENVRLQKSGEPGSPITIFGGTLAGADARLTVEGQHDVVVTGISVTGTTTGAAIRVANSHDVSLPVVTTTPAGGATAIEFADSTAISVGKANVSRKVGSTGTARGVVLTNVANSELRYIAGGSNVNPGVLLDETTHDVRIVRPAFLNGIGPGVVVRGPDNAVIGGVLSAFTGSGIEIAATALRTTVANNSLSHLTGVGIDNAGAAGTAITNNTVTYACVGIRVAAGSRDVSVQNNLARASGSADECAATPDRGQISVLGDAAASTTVDYNLLNTFSVNTAYFWGDRAHETVAAFQQASGQGAHEIAYGGSASWVPLSADSANSAAPGWQNTDITFQPRIDDMRYANTGAGPVTYADRGAGEAYEKPTTRAVATRSGLAVCVDASNSTTGTLPISAYYFDFGDGVATTQSSPYIRHQYTTAGSWTITVKALDSLNNSGIIAELPVTTTGGVLPSRTTCGAVLPRR